MKRQAKWVLTGLLSAICLVAVMGQVQRFPGLLDMACVAITGGNGVSESSRARIVCDAATLTLKKSVSGDTYQRLTWGTIEEDLVLADTNTWNVTTTKHGFVPKGSGSATEYLDGTGNWSIPGSIAVYTATVADVANTISETTAVSFTVPGGKWADGDVVRVFIADLHKNNKGTDGTVTAKVNVGAGAQVTLVNAQVWANDATEYKRASGAFSMMRVGSDVWVYDGASLSSGVISTVAGGAAGVSTPTNFTGDNLVSLKITLSAADATFYYKPQVAQAVKYNQP